MRMSLSYPRFLHEYRNHYLRKRMKKRERREKERRRHRKRRRRKSHPEKIVLLSHLFLKILFRMQRQERKVQRLLQHRKQVDNHRNEMNVENSIIYYYIFFMIVQCLIGVRTNKDLKRRLQVIVNQCWRNGWRCVNQMNGIWHWIRERRKKYERINWRINVHVMVKSILSSRWLKSDKRSKNMFIIIKPSTQDNSIPYMIDRLNE